MFVAAVMACYNKHIKPELEKAGVILGFSRYNNVYSKHAFL